MVLDFDTVRARLLKTQAIQKQLQETWVWDQVSVEDWGEGIQRLDVARDTAQDAIAATQNTRATLGEGLKELHEATKQTLGIAKVAFKREPSKAGAFVGLTAVSKSFPAVSRSAHTLSSAWQKADPTWTPLPGKTLASYDTLRATLQTQQADVASAVTAQKVTHLALQDTLKEQFALAKDWYAVATRVFPANTAEGQVLRAEIPT